MTTFLTGMLLKGRVVTMDALLTQRDIAKQIVEGQGEYVMIVKDNQPTLRRDLATYFEGANGLPADAGCPVEHAESFEKSHGRLELRRIETTTALNAYVDWPRASQTFRIERRTTLRRSGKERHDSSTG